MCGAPVAWRSQRQSAVSKSTTEAEYMSASEAAAEVVWVRDMLEDIGLIADRPSEIRSSHIFIDNRGAIDLIKTEAIKRRSRHIEIRYHLIRDWVKKDELSPKYVPTEDNVADGLTKPLAKDPFRTFRTRLSMSTPEATPTRMGGC